MSNIKAILFDLGGVLFNIDYNKPIQNFEALGIPNAAELFSQASQTSLFDDLETGIISTKYFYNALREITKTNITNTALECAWNSILLDFPEKRLQLIRALRKTYPIYLLSNTNEIHEKGFNLILNKSLGIENLHDEFNKIFFSHCIHLRKPNENAFLHVLNEINLKANEVLFIEDSIQHIETAQRLGFQTIHHQTNSDPENSIRKLRLI